MRYQVIIIQYYSLNVLIIVTLDQEVQFNVTEEVLEQLKTAVDVNWALSDTSAANQLPKEYLDAPKHVKKFMEKLDMFKFMNSLIKHSVNNIELLQYYKPTNTQAKTGNRDKIALPSNEYKKLLGK